MNGVGVLDFTRYKYAFGLLLFKCTLESGKSRWADTGVVPFQISSLAKKRVIPHW